MANNSRWSGLIRSINKLIRDPMVIYILTKFGVDWLIFVDLECKQGNVNGRRTDDGQMDDRCRWTVSGHNSSL